MLFWPPRIVHHIPSPLQILNVRSKPLPLHMPGCIPRVSPATAPLLRPVPLLQLQYSRVKLQPPPSVAFFCEEGRMSSLVALQRAGAVRVPGSSRFKLPAVLSDSDHRVHVTGLRLRLRLQLCCCA